MKPFQSVLTKKALAGIWLFFFAVDTLTEHFHAYRNSDNHPGWGTSILSGIILATGVTALFIIRQHLQAKRSK